MLWSSCRNGFIKSTILRSRVTTPALLKFTKNKNMLF
jgi:hypothetical protein